MSIPTPPIPNRDKGFALITVMIMVGVLAALITAYFTITQSEVSSQRSQISLDTGFNAAEGGLNLRAKALRNVFQGYNAPTGTPPTATNPCQSGNNGTGDYACVDYGFGKRTATTYMTADSGNPTAIVIPSGELFAHLNAQEYTYNIYSDAGVDPAKPEAILMLTTQVRLVPLFQFAAFYNKDLEVLPGPDMTLAGPVHVNGDLYLGSGGTLAIGGQTTVSGNLYHGRKDQNSCSGKVTITDSGGTPQYDTPYSTASSACSGTRKQVTSAMLPIWTGNVQTGVNPVQVPSVADMSPVSGATYWDNADLRVVLILNGGGHPTGIQVSNQDGSNNVLATNDLASCGNAVSYSDQSSSPHGLYNPRESQWITMLDVNMRNLLTCAQQHNTTILNGRSLDDTTNGGLVFYFTIKGPNSNTINNYGVRLRNGATLASNNSTDPTIQGLTAVTDQAVYVQGDYNSVSKKPAAILADSFNVLSNNWNDANSYNSSGSWNQRVATSTTINAAILAGTDETGGAEGTAGQDNGGYNGGLENYPRLLEQWSGKTLTLLGSFVSLNVPQHVNGTWGYGDPQYTAPDRNFGYDTSFNNAANLPPLSPRFVYLRQQLFDRTYTH